MKYINTVRAERSAYFNIKEGGIYLQDRQCTYKHNIETRSRNHFCRGNAISTTHSERVSVALVNQQAMRMRCGMLSCVACPALPYFFT
jgi:hypothetical protein